MRDCVFDTMAANDGAGLAAPQIGVPQRIMIFGIESSSRYPDAESVPMTVLINPEFDIVDTALQGFWEGCLSVPGMRGYVERPADIRYRGLDASGEPIERAATGFHAIVFQHEYDHLDGILFIERMEKPHFSQIRDEVRALRKKTQATLKEGKLPCAYPE